MFRSLSALFWKDLLTELRTKEVLTATVIFSVLVVVIFRFAFPMEFSATDLAPGCLWVAYAFAGILSLNRTFMLEREGQRVHGLMLAPMDRSTIYVAKVAANFVFMAVNEFIVFIVFWVFFNLQFTEVLPQLALVFALGTLGFVAVGTLFSAVAANTRMRDVMLPVLLLPVVFPLLTTAVMATGALLRGGDPAEVSQGIGMLVAFDLLFLAICYVLFEYAIEE